MEQMTGKMGFHSPNQVHKICYSRCLFRSLETDRREKRTEIRCLRTSLQPCFVTVQLSWSALRETFVNMWNFVLQHSVSQGCLGGLLRHLLRAAAGRLFFQLTLSPSCFGSFILKTYFVILTSRYLVTFSGSYQQEGSFFMQFQSFLRFFHILYISSFKTSPFLRFSLSKGLVRESDTSSSVGMKLLLFSF